jgi:predicted dehydrogenase
LVIFSVFSWTARLPCDLIHDQPARSCERTYIEAFVMRSAGPPLRGALIGCGFVSRFHLEAWSRVPQAQLVALCDLDPQRLEQAAALAPHAKTYTSAAELFAKEEELDFVEICTQPESHCELVDLAARHGVDILCQKPAALVRSDFRDMIDACISAGVRLMIHENWRFRPWYRAMRGLIDSGAIGRPIRVRIAHHDMRALRSGGYDDQSYQATMRRLILMDMGCHLIDTARYLIGEIQTVSATIGRFSRNNLGEDVAMLAVYFAGGALGWLDFSWCAAPDQARPEWALNETFAEGSAGTLRLLTDGSLELISPSGAREHHPVSLPADDRVYVEGYAATQRHFIDGLLTGAEHETRAADNLKTMDVVWAAYRSAEEGRTLAV